MALRSQDTSAGASVLAEVLAILSLLVSAAGLTISLAALTFSGPLADGLPRGTTVFLLGAGITTALVALRGSVPGAISPVQDGPTIVLVAVVARLAAESGANFTADQIIVVTGLASLITGLLMAALGSFSLGGIVRFIPAVVINAFVAGTGCLLFLGGLSVMTDSGGHGLSPASLFTPEQIKFWLPGVALGLAAYLVSGRPGAPKAAVPGLIIMATVVFYIVTLAASSIQAVEEASWLIGPFTDPPSPSLITPSEVADVAWSDIIAQLPGLAAVAAVATLALMLNVSGLESVTNHRADLNDELKVTGTANILQSVLGAAPSFHAIGFTALANRMGATSKRVSVAVGGLLVLFGLLGTAIVGYTPRFVVGALLVAVGVGLIMDWVGEMRRAPGITDTVLSLIIIGCIVGVGVLEGIVLGVVIACGVFIVRYSRVDPVRRWRTGATARSQVDRSVAETEALVAGGDRLRVAELQGFLFFGSVTGMTDRIMDECRPPVEQVVFDFRHVTGIDGSALSLLHRLIDDLTEQGVTVRLASAPQAAVAQGLTNHPTLDEALAEVEQLILTDHSNETTTENAVPDELLAVFERRTVPAGTTLLAAGDDADELIYLLAGTLSVFAPGEIGQGQKPFRLRKATAPSWIGEIGFLRRTERTADVVTDTEVELAVIDRETFDRLRRQQPDAVIQLLDNIASEQARLVDTLSSALSEASG